MPTYVEGDLGEIINRPFDRQLVFFTANGVVRNYKLVMGGGFAQVVKRQFPRAPEVFGRYIMEVYDQVASGMYLYKPVWLSLNEYTGHIGAFQVKLDYALPASRLLIEINAEYLRRLASFDLFDKIHINFPGIGLGRLLEADVKPLLKSLPESVYVWRK